MITVLSFDKFYERTSIFNFIYTAVATCHRRGPVPATQKALAHSGPKVDDIDFWEINETFTIVTINAMDRLKNLKKKLMS